MTTYNFYRHIDSGDIATLDSWRSDYEAMDIESWHGHSVEECVEENWIEAGHLETLELKTVGEYYPTNRRFPGSFNDSGEDYISEWACRAVDDEDNEYMIIWQFPAVKGAEPAEDEWPWGDKSTIFKIKTV